MNMMKGQLAGLMKQAQQMQEKMAKMQAEIGALEVEGQSGGGMVKVVMTTAKASTPWIIQRSHCQAFRDLSDR